MKILPYIIGIILLANAFACQRETTYPLAMKQAESLMNTRPDSALYLLQNMVDSVSALPEEAQMYYHLLAIQAKDKQYITHTSDSLINRIVEFYEDYGNNDRLMLAYFYQGSTYRDMNDAPQALKAFQQAVDLNVPNLNLLAKTYNQMGNLFMYQGLYDEAIRVNQKSMVVYLSLGKQNKISYALRDIARMYDVKNMPDSALYYYKEACSTAMEDGDPVHYYGLLGEIGGFYYKIGNLNLAKEILLKVKNKKTSKNLAHVFLYLGEIYEDLQQRDSAYYYYHKTLYEEDIYKKSYAFYNLAWLEYHRGKPSEAMKYMNQHILLKDSIDKINQTEAITKINALYNYQHTADKNAKLKLTNESQKNKILLSLFALVCTITLACSIFSYQRKKSKEALRVAHILGQLEAEKHKQSLAAIKENEQKIAELTDLQKEAKHQNNHLLQELTLLQKEMMELRNREIKDTNNNEEIRIKTFEQSSLYGLLKRASINDKINISAEDWNRIQSTLDFVYPHFRKRLQDLYPNLSIIEEQVCWLIKLSINPAGIARIVKRSNSAISNIRARLHKKIHKASENSKTFDEIIKNL